MSRLKLIRKIIPKQLRYLIQQYVSLTEIKLKERIRNNELADLISSDENSSNWPVRIGILTNAAQYHKHYVKACLELGIPFTVVDIYGHDWLEKVKNSGCSVFVNWPDAFLPIWNSMMKDRIAVIERDLGLMVMPSGNDIWAYEDKSRMAYWLKANNVPCPETTVFYSKTQALNFAEACPLPIVVKTNFGAAGVGVRIFRERKSLIKLVRKVFRSGWIPAGIDYRNKQWGSILFQEYIPDVVEWRLVRIGDSYFGHAKGKSGDFHSGSGKVVWSIPEPRHLDFLHDICELGGFRSMDLDVFEAGGKFYVNEIQAVFGASVSVDQLRIDGKSGRYIRSKEGEWIFEEGDFARNACANERIRYLVERYQETVIQETTDGTA